MEADVAATTAPKEVITLIEEDFEVHEGKWFLCGTCTYVYMYMYIHVHIKLHSVWISEKVE